MSIHPVEAAYVLKITMNEKAEFKKSCVKGGMAFIKKHKGKAASIGCVTAYSMWQFSVIEFLDLISIRWTGQSQLIGWVVAIPVIVFLLALAILVGVVGYKVIKWAYEWDI